MTSVRASLSVLAALVAVLISVAGSRDVARADPTDNGAVAGPGLDDPAIVVNAGWWATTEKPPAFFWSGAGQPFNVEGPYTWNHPTSVILRVTDDFLCGDQFRIYDFGVQIGDTSAVAKAQCVEVGPAAAYANPKYSSGSWPLDAGAHSITIQTIVNPWDAGRGYIRVDDFSLMVGGVVELPSVPDALSEASGSASSRDYTAPLAAVVAAAVLAIAASGWYVRRRWFG